jgi:hypothetical protein
MMCHGSCTTEKQIAWLYDMEFMRSDTVVRDLVTNDYYKTFLPDAQKAADGYSNGTNSSWFWGEVSGKEKETYWITAETSVSYYPGKPWFIVYSGRKVIK